MAKRKKYKKTGNVISIGGGESLQDKEIRLAKETLETFMKEHEAGLERARIWAKNVKHYGGSKAYRDASN